LPTNTTKGERDCRRYALVLSTPESGHQDRRQVGNTYTIPGERLMSKVIALVGAQYGSEGKGVVSYALRNKVGVAVRTGGPNAGHSFVHDGTLYKMQSIP